MYIFINLIAVVTIITTIGFIISIGTPAYLVALVMLGLIGPLLCSLGIIFNEGK